MRALYTGAMLFQTAAEEASPTELLNAMCFLLLRIIPLTKFDNI